MFRHKFSGHLTRFQTNIYYHTHDYQSTDLTLFIVGTGYISFLDKKS